MKQKLFLLLMLVVALAACTKDDDEYDDYVAEAPGPRVPNGDDSVNTNYEFGTFEGDWILEQQVISESAIVVMDSDYVEFHIPGDIVVSKALKVIGMEKDINITEIYPRYMRVIPLGLSDNKAYYNFGFYDLRGMQAEIQANMQVNFSSTSIYGGMMYYDVDHSNREMMFFLISERPSQAIYDIETGLWTLKIKIIQVFVYDGLETKIYDLPSPFVLLFVAKKKL